MTLAVPTALYSPFPVIEPISPGIFLPLWSALAALVSLVREPLRWAWVLAWGEKQDMLRLELGGHLRLDAKL